MVRDNKAGATISRVTGVVMDNKAAGQDTALKANSSGMDSTTMAQTTKAPLARVGHNQVTILKYLNNPLNVGLFVIVFSSSSILWMTKGSAVCTAILKFL